jgi:hypothetical protein
MFRVAIFGLLTLAACSRHIADAGGTTGGGSVVHDAGVPPSPNCPQEGGSMVEIPEMQGGSYCIDQNLVTNAAYAKWLDANPSQDLRPLVCQTTSPFCSRIPCADIAGWRAFYHYEPFGWGLSGLNDQGLTGLECADTPMCPQEFADPACNLSVWPVAAKLGDYPVVNVTWCDAYAYCADHHKRLCGRIGGGPLTVHAPSDQPNVDQTISSIAPSVTEPAVSEIANAATHSGKQKYPYGDNYDETACPVSAYCYMPNSSSMVGKLHPVESVASCEGGYPGVFDLVGNAAEFINACDFDDPQLFMNGQLMEAAGCIVAGGADDSGITAGWLFFPITDSNTGFRCCADVEKN